MPSDFLRHTIATLAYRGGKAVRDVPADFSAFRAGPGSRTAGEILAHLGDLLDWALSLAEGAQRWEPRAPQDWAADVTRFHDGLAKFDAYLESGAPLGSPAEKLFQGPIADALTHVGQIAMLRRLAGGPVKGENYHRAEIAIGRVGSDQANAVREF
ncbi:MAG TPA: hypothetical protein VES67_22660 [Vicinamibacterales bacterium]|nr:hypothetical protein [Vicinamibacterales bacterium]